MVPCDHADQHHCMDGLTSPAWLPILRSVSPYLCG
jgi:hypothetical protein